MELQVLYKNFLWPALILDVLFSLLKLLKEKINAAAYVKSTNYDLVRKEKSILMMLNACEKNLEQ